MSRGRRDVMVLVASLAVFAVYAVIAADGRVGPIERAAFHAVNGLPEGLYGPMLAFQYLGVLAMPLIVAVGALAFRRWRLAAALVLVVPCKLALERVVKLLVQRERPGTTVGDAILRGVHPGGLSLSPATPSSPSPSPACWPWCCRAAGGGGIRAGHPERGRLVYLGAHNPLDVVGGAAVGLAIAAVLDLLLDVTRDRAGSARSSTLIDKASLARAAVSCSSRHSAFSRTLTSSRRHSRSSSARGIALVLSAGSGRRSRSMAMPSASQRRPWQNPRNERTVATCRFQVAGARPPQAVVTATVTPSRVSIDSGRSPLSSCRKIWRSSISSSMARLPVMPSSASQSGPVSRPSTQVATRKSRSVPGSPASTLSAR